MTRRAGEGACCVPGVVALAALVVLLGLGTWQLERKAWKEALIATLDRRLNDAPIALPPPAEWAGHDAGQFRIHPRASARRVLRSDSDALVYTSGSAIRDDVKGAGYFVFSPARLPGGQQVVVNRGFVPRPRLSGGVRPAGHRRRAPLAGSAVLVRRRP